MGMDLKDSKQVTTPQLTAPHQNLLGNQTNAYLSTFLPGYQDAMRSAANAYNTNLAGVTNAGQNLVSTAGRAQNVLGGTGQQALQTGISGLSNLFGPEYEQQQINAALAPAQYQYRQNLANLGAQFGGAGQLGSAREALASQNLASTNAMNQSTLVAGIQNQIANQRMNAGQSLAQLGQTGLTQGIGAANAAVAGSQVPMNMINQYLAGIASIPNQMPQFGGTIGSIQDTRTAGGNVTPKGVAEGIGTAGQVVDSLGRVINAATGGTGGVGGAIGSVVSGGVNLIKDIFG